MRSSLQLLSPNSSSENQTQHVFATDDAPHHAADAMTTGLQRLHQACHTRRNADLKLETSSCKLAAVLAKMVADADLLNRRLPRNYIARVNCGEAYLVKCAPNCDEAVFILARRESTFARMEPRARELSNAQILEFMRDVEDGLINEIADFVESCNSSDRHAALCLDRVLLACDHSAFPHAPQHQVAALDAPMFYGTGESRSMRALPARRSRRESKKTVAQDKLPLSA